MRSLAMNIIYSGDVVSKDVLKSFRILLQVETEHPQRN